MFLGFFFGLGALGVLGSRAIVPGRLSSSRDETFGFLGNSFMEYLPIQSK